MGRQIVDIDRLRKEYRKSQDQLKKYRADGTLPKGAEYRDIIRRISYLTNRIRTLKVKEDSGDNE